MSCVQIDTRLIAPLVLLLYEESDKRREFSDFKRSQERRLTKLTLDRQSVENLEQEALAYLDKNGCSLEEAARKYDDA